MTKQQTTKDITFASTFAVLTAVAAFLLATVGVVVVSTKDNASSVTASGPTTIEVKLSEFKIDMSPATAPAGEITLHVTNAGAQIHNLDIAQLNKKTADIAPGAAATLDLGQVPAGSYDVICAIPGHADAGMKTTLVVGGGSGASTGSTMAGMTMSGGATTAGNPDDAKIDFTAAPGPEFTARDPNAPPPLSGTVHDLTIEASENVLEVAPGVKQQMWTFNLAGQTPTVPGPILRGNVGDTFRVTLVNKGTVDHSIDFHASKVAWDDKMRSIHPGESLIYEFTANYAGAFMYHCGTAPALHHIGNGMYGAIIINPANLAPVDHEFVLVQSEIYLGPDSQPGDLTKMTNNAWDAVVFNGYVNQYKFSPIRVEPNQRVRVWLIDDGPSENSAFHIVGTIFDTVWKEGRYLLQPDASHGGSQVLDLQPAQGGFVEFTLAEKGFYPIVTHKFSNVGKGAMGLFQAGDAVMPANSGH
jgi:nitrite reductase (NO-forming)